MKTRTIGAHKVRRARRTSQNGDCRLPHERDEAAETGGEPRPEIAIAERDIRQGRVDTDNYTRLREVGEAGLRKHR
jgi:hypothetical protein